MKEEWLSVKEVAGFLGCSVQTVRNLVRGRWVTYRKFKGRNNKKKWRISLTSVKLYILQNSATRDEIKRYRRGKRKIESISEITHKTDEAILCNIVEGPQGKFSSPMSPGEIAVHYQFMFGCIAQHLARRDPALQDDLVQEMTRCVLEHDQPATQSFILTHALWRARDYLKYERQRGIVSLDEILQYADRDEAEVLDFEHKLRRLVKDYGIPRNWIETVIGMSFDTAV
jgi:DNA-directed RNA polymerase specialized sigma24 family protein